MNDDRLLPQCVAIEMCILASFLGSDKIWLKYSIMIKPEYFYVTMHRRIFETMQKLNTTDIQIIIEALPEFEDHAIAGILENIGGNINLENEIAILKDRYERREIIAASEEAIEKSFTDFDCSPFEILQNATARVTGCTEHYNPPEAIRSIIPRVFEKIDAAQLGENGLKTGVSDVDTMIGGFLDDEFIIVAGRPAMGKTAFCLQIARHNALIGKIPVLIFSIETGKVTLSARILFAEAKVSFEAVMNKYLPQRELPLIGLSAGPVTESEIYIDDTAGISINQIEAVTEMYVKNHGIKLVIIDHIGLVHNPQRGRSRHEELSEISKRIKACGKRSRVPIIAVCQLSRTVESRKPPIPMLSDLRESGSLEEDTDKVIFLYRDEYYNRQSNKKNIAEIILAKNKNGKTGYKEIRIDLPTMTFSNLSITEEWQDKI
jgi:replicative DNA helicase